MYSWSWPLPCSCPPPPPLALFAKLLALLPCGEARLVTFTLVARRFMLLQRGRCTYNTRVLLDNEKAVWFRPYKRVWHAEPCCLGGSGGWVLM